MSEVQNIVWKQSWGRGTLKIYKACREAGLPDPSIIEKNGGIEVTLYKVEVSEQLRRSFVQKLETLNEDIDHNMELVSSNYGLFIDFLAVDLNTTSEKLRRNFGVNAEEFRSKFGDRKAILLFLIAGNPQISASTASKYLEVSSRSVQTYFNDLKESTIKRVGADRGGHWKIVL